MMTRVLLTWAADAGEFAAVLARHDGGSAADTFELSGGRVVLCGPGMWMNEAFAVGLIDPMTSSEFELLEARSEAVGVPPAIQISPATHRDVRSVALERGYVSASTISALRYPLHADQPSPRHPEIVMEPAADQLAVWQETSAGGWGHDSPDRKRASDAFAAVAAEVDRDGFVLARDADDDRPIACASLSIRDGVATLRAMSTLPTERRRGVQAALVHHRLRAARAAGCTVATTTVAPGGESERNLVRIGFEPWFTIERLVRTAP